MYWFNASISKRKTSLLITFCKCSCKIYIFTHFRTFVYLKWKIYKPDFAQIMQILAVVSDSYFCLSVCPFVYHIVFIEVATAIIEALQCKTLFFHPMCDSFNFYLCMILIVVVCMIFFFYLKYCWNESRYLISYDFTQWFSSWAEKGLFVEAGILIFEVHINDNFFKIVIYLQIS